MDDPIDFNDTKLLRRNMFVSNSEREEHLHRVKMRKLNWDRIRLEMRNDESWNSPGGLSECHRALFDVDVSHFVFPEVVCNYESYKVLENIAVYLPNCDLLNCRLVCKLWSCEMATNLFKRKCLVVTNEHCTASDDLLKKRLEGHPVCLSKLGFFDISPSCVIYKKLFSTFGWTLSSVSVEDCNLTPQDLKQMLLVLAPNLEYLSLKDCEFKSNSKTSTFKQIKNLNNGSFLLPHLKFLHWDEEHGKTDLKDIAEACPNLATLELRNFPLPKPTTFQNLQWESLKQLFLSPRNSLREEHCKALIQLKLKLRKLTLFGIDPGEKKAIKFLSKFLESIAETLETLELWLDYASILADPTPGKFSPFPVTLPYLKRLQTEKEIIGQLKYLNKMPSLTELEIVSNPYEGQSWSTLSKRCTIPPQPSLHSFRCGDIDGRSLSKVMNTFPRITCLQLYASHVNDLVLRMIIKSLPELQDLTISPCTKTHLLRLTDSGITGISKELCSKFLKNPKIFAKDIDLDSVKKKPGINDLRHLQHLNLSLQVSELTDVSVFLSISRLTNLCSLKMPLCKITDASLELLDERLNHLVLLGVAGCKNVSQEAITSLQRRRTYLIVENHISPGLEHLIRRV